MLYAVLPVATLSVEYGVEHIKKSTNSPCKGTEIRSARSPVLLLVRGPPDACSHILNYAASGPHLHLLQMQLGSSLTPAICDWSSASDCCLNVHWPLPRQGVPLSAGLLLRPLRCLQLQQQDVLQTCLLPIASHVGCSPLLALPPLSHCMLHLVVPPADFWVELFLR